MVRGGRVTGFNHKTHKPHEKKRSWSAVSPFTIAKRLAPMIIHRVIGDAMAVGIRELEKIIFIHFC
jgi:hypothetical protein